ncbi:MAG: ornithine carbamoyltransferase [Brevinematia bacterium]
MLEGKKDFLDTDAFSPQALLYLIELGLKIKKNKKRYSKSLAGKKLGMIFEKSSTRTRVSFEVGMYELGGMSIFLSSREIQLGRGETIEDTAKVLSRYLDAIMIRTYSQNDVEILARESTIPVINGLTDLLHPCQAMADFMTILEKKGRLEGLKLCFIGDGNNMAHSLGLLSSKLGVNFSIATPKGYEMSAEITERIRKNARESGALVEITSDPFKAISGADVVYTDVWTSMGQENERERRLRDFSGFEVNDNLVKNAKEDFIFMHCLPAHRGEEVSASVIDGKNSVVFDEAENRLHIQKAILLSLIK